MAQICAVIVTYNIDESFKKNYNSVKNQVDKIIIVDNNSKASSIEILNNLEDNSKKTKIVYNQENVGLSKAQNQGISLALDEKINWILLLDDDSNLSDNMVGKLMKAYWENDDMKVGILAPNIKDKNSFKKQKYIFEEGLFNINRRELKEEYNDDIFTVIASGSLIKTSLIKKIGMMKEKFFIDSIDTEFSLRSKVNGYKILIVRDAIIYHELGKTSTKSIANIKIYPTNHAVFRQYYIFRNRIYVWKKYFLIFPNYVIYEFLASIYHLIKIILFERNKMKKLKRALIGIKDGILGKLI